MTLLWVAIGLLTLTQCGALWLATSRWLDLRLQIDDAESSQRKLGYDIEAVNGNVNGLRQRLHALTKHLGVKYDHVGVTPAHFIVIPIEEKRK